MKNKVTYVIILVLILFNVYLYLEVHKLQNILDDVSGEQIQIIENKYVDFNDDLTHVVEQSINKVVGITSYASNRLIATGSGAIIEVDNEEVYIVTNHHVISNADKISVVFANGNEFESEFIGSDVFSDLALLKAKPDFSVNAFKIGDSASAKIGELVLAIGSPLGLEFQSSVTLGVLSGKDRTIGVDLDGNGIEDWDMNVLQTDAAINPGNSGGPLINLKGEIIGINSMKIILSQVEGMGFSIPIDEAVVILDQLKEFNKVIRPVIGVMAMGVSEMSLYQKNALGIDLNQEQGVFITEIVKQGPAEQAGVEAGDVIVAIDDTKIESFKQFRQILYSKKIGDTINVKLMRKNQSVTIAIKLQ